MAACMPSRSYWHLRKNVHSLLKSICSRVDARRWESNMKVNHAVMLDPEVEKSFQEGEMKPRKHPGIMRVKTVHLPPKLTQAMTRLLDRFPTQDLSTKKMTLINYLWSRHPPQEDEELMRKAAIYEKELLEKVNVDIGSLSPDEHKAFAAKMKKKLLQKLRYSTYHWQPIQYDAFQGFLYMAARMSNDYSALYRIFHEIHSRDRTFTPINLFDFGSGVGSVAWAANSIWPGKIQEHFCVDVSQDMNTIARLLLQGGEEEAEPCFSNVFFRQTFPISSPNKYDLVVSAFTLLELPSQKERLRAILSLWQKTDNYLVLVELGTYAGFQLIDEARECILKLSETAEDVSSGECLDGHVFAPCPHDSVCPLKNSGDRKPCNTDVDFFEFKTERKNQLQKRTARFSYVVLKKGPRNPEDQRWPRLVRSCSNGNHYVHCPQCTPDGQLEYCIIRSRKHGKFLYKCARSSSMGDLLPVQKCHNAEDLTEESDERNGFI